MRVSLVGALQNAAEALDAFDELLGGEEAEGDAADLVCEHQPRMMAYVLRETARNLEAVKANPAVLGEFLDLYCVLPASGPPQDMLGKDSTR